VANWTILIIIFILITISSIINKA